MVLYINSKHEMEFSGCHRYHFVEDDGYLIRSCSTKEEAKLYLSILGKNMQKIFKDWNNSFIYDKSKSMKGYRSAYIILG